MSGSVCLANGIRKQSQQKSEWSTGLRSWVSFLGHLAWSDEHHTEQFQGRGRRPSWEQEGAGEGGSRITACWQHQAARLGWLSFLPNCSPALLGLCYPKHIIKCMQLLCRSPAKLLLLHIMGQMNLQILVDSRTSFVLGSCWQLRQVVEQWCNVLPLQEILLARGAI